MNKDFLWVRQVIASCINLFQLDGCHALLLLYKQKYPELKQDYETLLSEIQDRETFISVDA